MVDIIYTIFSLTYYMTPLFSLLFGLLSIVLLILTVKLESHLVSSFFKVTFSMDLYCLFSYFGLFFAFYFGVFIICVPFLFVFSFWVFTFLLPFSIHLSLSVLYILPYRRSIDLGACEYAQIRDLEVKKILMEKARDDFGSLTEEELEEMDAYDEEDFETIEDKIAEQLTRLWSIGNGREALQEKKRNIFDEIGTILFIGFLCSIPIAGPILLAISDYDNLRLGTARPRFLKWEVESVRVHGETIEVKYVKKMRVLDLSVRGIEDIEEIEGLEHLTDLDVLNLWGNKITEIKGLGHLIYLRGLNLLGNKITEIKGLEHLKNLEELVLIGNPIREDEKKYITSEAQEIVQYCRDKPRIEEKRRRKEVGRQQQLEAESQRRQEAVAERKRRKLEVERQRKLKAPKIILELAKKSPRLKLMTLAKKVSLDESEVLPIVEKMFRDGRIKGKYFPKSKIIIFKDIPTTILELTKGIQLIHLKEIASKLKLEESEVLPIVQKMYRDGHLKGQYFPKSKIVYFQDVSNILLKMVKDIPRILLRDLAGNLSLDESEMLSILTEMLRDGRIEGEYFPKSKIIYFTEVSHFILEIATKYPQFTLPDLVTKLSLEESEALEALNKLFESGRLKGEYFPNTKMIYFQKVAAEVEAEIDALLAKYKAWEDRQVGKE